VVFSTIAAGCSCGYSTTGACVGSGCVGVG